MRKSRLLSSTSRRSTYVSSRSDDQSGTLELIFFIKLVHSSYFTDIKLAVRGNDRPPAPSQSPPPVYEEYIVQKVVNVGIGNTQHNNENGNGVAPQENENCVDGNNGHSNDFKVDLSEQLDSECTSYLYNVLYSIIINFYADNSTIRGSMIEEQKIKFTDSVIDVRFHQVEGTNL